MINWIFASPRRLQQTAAGLAVVIIVLMITLTYSRMAGMDRTPPTDPFSAATAEPDPTSSALLPASPAPDEGSPLPDYGTSAPVALEAVQAFLLNDAAGFARLAQQEAVEGVNEAPARPAGQQITGQVRTVHGGPTRQTLDVPTTDGVLRLDMIIVDGAWKVLNMEYRR